MFLLTNTPRKEQEMHLKDSAPDVLKFVRLPTETCALLYKLVKLQLIKNYNPLDFVLLQKRL